jgi:hypothetical protein
MNPFAFAVMALLLIQIRATGAPVLLIGGISPDGKVGLEIGHNSHGDGRDQLEILSRDGAIVGTFDWPGFESETTARSASVLWASDSSAAALNWYAGKNQTTSAVYARQGARWIDVSLPYKRLDQSKWICPGKGCYIAVEWLAGNILKMDYDDGAYRLAPSGRRILAKPLWVYLQLEEHSHGAALSVKKTEEYSAEEN